MIAAENVGNNTPVEDPRVAALVSCLQGEEGVLPDVRYAYDLYSDTAQRAVLDAFALAKVTAEATAKIFEIPVSVIETYRYLFMDTGAFRNKLELRVFAQDYDGDAAGRELVRTALQAGPEYLRWAYGDGSVDLVDSRTVVRRAMHDAHFRSLAHKGNALTSGMAKEAHKWMGTATRYAQVLEAMDPQTSQNAIAELRLVIEGRDNTHSTDAAPVPVTEILK